jgi:hypothetical protein
MKQITDAERIQATLTLGLKSTVDADGRVTVYHPKAVIGRVSNCFVSTEGDRRGVYNNTFVTDCPDWRKSMVGAE